MSDTTQILLGALGGLIPDVLRIVRTRHDPSLPPYLKSIAFYVGLGLAMVVGAVAVVLIDPQSRQEALAIGFGAPEILTRLLSSHPAAGASRATAPPAPVRTIGQWWGE